MHSVPCAVMSTMVLAVSADVGGSTPSAHGAACGAAGPRRRRDCSAKEGSVDDDDDVEGDVEIDAAASLDVAAAEGAAAALGTTVELLEAGAVPDGVDDATRALSWAAKADMAA